MFKIHTLGLDNRKKEYLYFSELFEENSNILVIGANTGITTIPVAKNIRKGKVVAIEPVQVNYMTLLKVIKHFKLNNIIPVNLALGNESGSADMVLPVINKTRSHGMAYVNDGTVEGFPEGISYKVKIRKLDDLEEIKDLRISGIKIVTENYEKLIFEGGEKTIKKNRPIIYCELWHNENRKKTLSLIKSWNYEIKVLENKILVPYSEIKHFTKNLFFIPASVNLR